MKSLTNYINERAKNSETGETYWQKAFDRMLWQENITKADFDEVQQDDWIWDNSTGDPATTDFLMELYTKFKNEKVEWVAQDIGNVIEYTLTDKKGHEISFDSTEMLKF